jgi:hypothetical protein
MKTKALHVFIILFFMLGIGGLPNAKAQQYSLDFYNGTFNFEVVADFDIIFNEKLSNQSVRSFYRKIDSSNYSKVVTSLLKYKEEHDLNDWLYYQLIRKTAQQIAPKQENYVRYTLYKWFLMCKSGYDARIAVGDDQIIFYIRNSEDISDIPFFEVDQKKYTCLNYHDYGKLFKNKDAYFPVKINVPEAKYDFSYKVTKMPDFKPENYTEKQIAFNYKHKAYHFNIKVNTDVTDIFANYPVVDFESYFNIPLSKETYQSLIPILKENVKAMSIKKGVDYLMRFTRYAFLYEDDEETFGKEKRYSPEQTLLNPQSDCDDRAALFFYLVKEIYNLPMIAMLYPSHLTMAVAFDVPTGHAIVYDGKIYSVCEPTPQKQNLRMGEIADNLKNQKYQVVYVYNPLK